MYLMLSIFATKLRVFFVVLCYFHEIGTRAKQKTTMQYYKEKYSKDSNGTARMMRHMTVSQSCQQAVVCEVICGLLKSPVGCSAAWHYGNR